MSELPAITVSTTDRDRLFALLDAYQGDSDQVDHLYDELARAKIVSPELMPPGIVTLGSRVRFRNEANGKEHERVLVLPSETQTTDDAISILTAAGAALLGLQTGAIIHWPHQDRHVTLRLLEVRQPEPHGGA